MHYSLSDGLVEHLFIPLLQALWLGNLLVGWVAVEDVIIPLTGRTGPDVTCCKTDRGKRGCSRLNIRKYVTIFPRVSS